VIWCYALPGYEHEIVPQRVSPEHAGDAVPDLPPKPVSPHGVRQFLADRYADPEVTELVPGIKKRKTVS